MSATEHALAQQIHSLYSDHHGWLHGWLRKKLGCAHHAADLAHDTFVRLLVRPRELDSERNPRAYLSTIAHGLVVDHWRRQAIEQAWLETLAVQPEPCPLCRALRHRRRNARATGRPAGQPARQAAPRLHPGPVARFHLCRSRRRDRRVRTHGEEVHGNGNLIIDVHGLAIDDPKGLETRLNQIVGIVTNGLFAHRGADVLLLARADGVTRLARD